MTQKHAGLLLLAVSIACGSDSNDTRDVEQPVLYAVQHNVNAPDGRLVYINLIPSLDAPGAAIDTSNAIELSGYAAMQSFDGALFVAENESRTITRYEVDVYGRPTEAGRLSFAAEEIDTFWNENFLYLDTNTAWYANSAAGEILIWDPSAMEIRDRIVVEGLNDVSALPFDFEGLARVGDRVFLPLSFIDWDAYEADPSVAVAVFSISEQRLLGIWRDSRCALPLSTLPHMSVASDGTVYVVGDAGWGAWIHGASPAIDGTCALRILPGAEGFDPAWSISTDDAVEGYEGMMGVVVDDERARVFVDLMRTPETPLENVDAIWDWQYEPGVVRRATCGYPSFSDCAFVDESVEGVMHWFSTKLDGRLLMTTLREANPEIDDFGGCAVYDMTPAGPRELFVTEGFVSNVVRVR